MFEIQMSQTENKEFCNLNFGIARPVKYGMSYLWFDFHDSSGKVRSSISNRIT